MQSALGDTVVDYTPRPCLCFRCEVDRHHTRHDDAGEAL